MFRSKMSLSSSQAVLTAIVSIAVIVATIALRPVFFAVAILTVSGRS